MPLDNLPDFDPGLYRAEAQRLAFLRQIERSNRQLQRITAVVFWTVALPVLPFAILIGIAIGTGRWLWRQARG